MRLDTKKKTGFKDIVEKESKITVKIYLKLLIFYYKLVVRIFYFRNKFPNDPIPCVFVINRMQQDTSVFSM